MPRTINTQSTLSRFWVFIRDSCGVQIGNSRENSTRRLASFDQERYKNTRRQNKFLQKVKPQIDLSLPWSCDDFSSVFPAGNDVTVSVSGNRGCDVTITMMTSKIPDKSVFPAKHTRSSNRKRSHYKSHVAGPPHDNECRKCLSDQDGRKYKTPSWLSFSAIVLVDRCSLVSHSWQNSLPAFSVFLLLLQQFRKRIKVLAIAKVTSRRLRLFLFLPVCNANIHS